VLLSHRGHGIVVLFAMTLRLGETKIVSVTREAYIFINFS
jgi:hypothetical protein